MKKMENIVKVVAGASNSWSGRLQLSDAENHNNFLGFSSREASHLIFGGCPTGHSPGLFGGASCSKGEFVPLGPSPLGLSPTSGRDGSPKGTLEEGRRCRYEYLTVMEQNQQTNQENIFHTFLKQRVLVINTMWFGA